MSYPQINIHNKMYVALSDEPLERIVLHLPHTYSIEMLVKVNGKKRPVNPARTGVQ